MVGARHHAASSACRDSARPHQGLLPNHRETPTAMVATAAVSLENRASQADTLWSVPSHRGSECASVAEHLAQLRELGAPAAAAALGVAMHLARLAGSEMLRPGQRDAALRLLIFLTVLKVSVLIRPSFLPGTYGRPFMPGMCC